jgi:hypothetical protein
VDGKCVRFVDGKSARFSYITRPGYESLGALSAVGQPMPIGASMVRAPKPSAAGKLGLVPLNLIVWPKTNAGMGNLYRSQHELLPLFKKGTAPHVNNIEVGKRGRWRSNVWTYPGASSLGSDARPGLKDHPTVKPTTMLENAPRP